MVRVVKSIWLPAKITTYLVSFDWPATLLGISLRMPSFTENIPGLATYFDNSVVYFKTF